MKDSTKYDWKWTAGMFLMIIIGSVLFPVEGGFLEDIFKERKVSQPVFEPVAQSQVPPAARHEFNVGVIIGGLLAGLLVGIIPVVVGALKNKLLIGIAGFFACAVSGLLLGLLLAVPICGVFVWLAARPQK